MISADVKIRDVAPIRVAVMTHHGDPAKVHATVERFVAWRKAHGLHPRDHPTFNVFHTDPRLTPPDSFRMDLCVATERRFAPGEVEAGIIPGDRCAALRVVGASAALVAGALFLAREWLPTSGEQADGSPLFCERHDDGVTLFLRLTPRAA